MLICMQKINFITYFFLKIFKKPQHRFEETFDVYLQAKKSTSSFTFSLRYCEDIANLLFWVLWVCLAMHTQSDNIRLQKTFVFICGQKTKFISHVFLEIHKIYTNFLICVLWACLTTHTQNDNMNLQKTSMFIRMPKIHFIIHFFLEILHFKESCNLTCQHFCP